MKLLKQQNGNCLVYSAAMVMNVDPIKIFEYIGHHGQKIIWPFLSGNARRVGVHIQEINHFAISQSLCFTPVEPAPCSRPGYHVPERLIYPHDVGITKFVETINMRLAILIGKNQQGNGHAVAWDGKLVYDPNGEICEIFDYTIKEAWVLAKMI